MAIQVAADDKVRQEFRHVRIMALGTLMELLACSRSTVQRRLKQWRCYTSYNRNGSFYALPEVVEFDEHGLWQHKSVGFSRHGNLAQTVLALVSDAPSGVTGAELSDVLNINANSFIGAFVKTGKISREKVGSRFVYTSRDEPVKQRQIRLRRDADQRCTQLSCADAVIVLIELIKTPALGPAALARTVRLRAPTASAEAIGQFFSEHGLSSPQKKGQPPF